MEEKDIKIIEKYINFNEINGTRNFKEALEKLLQAYKQDEKVIRNMVEENQLYRHRLEVANEYIKSRINNMIPEHYDDLKYIINECDMNSTW